MTADATSPPGERQPFAVSILAFRDSPGRRDTQHAAILLRALNADEARGMGYRVGARCFPARDGWRLDIAVSLPGLEITDPGGTSILADCN